MKIPESWKQLKFLLFPIVMVPVAVVVIALEPSQAQREAEAAADASRPTAPAHVETELVGELHDDTRSLSIELLNSHSTACDHVHPSSRYHAEEHWRVSVTVHNDDFSSRSNGCWRQYDNYAVTWDGRHYNESMVALCPLIDGLREYEGCVNVSRSRFGSQNSPAEMGKEAPFQAEREAASARPAPAPGDTAIIAVYRSDTGSSAELRDGHSARCDNLFKGKPNEDHRWQVALEADYGNRPKRACWRHYESNEKMWDGRRAPWPSIALCLPGACVAMPSSAFHSPQ
jgi:hypothetical protein